MQCQQKFDPEQNVIAHRMRAGVEVVVNACDQQHDNRGKYPTPESLRRGVVDPDGLVLCQCHGIGLHGQARIQRSPNQHRRRRDVQP